MPKPDYGSLDSFFRTLRLLGSNAYTRMASASLWLWATITPLSVADGIFHCLFNIHRLNTLVYIATTTTFIRYGNAQCRRAFKCDTELICSPGEDNEARLRLCNCGRGADRCIGSGGH